MINAYEVINGDKVLLVGEGNFSFSKDFLIFNKIGHINRFKQIEIVSSCKESIVEIFSDLKKEAINFLIEKGKVSLFYYNSSLVCLSFIYSKPKSDETLLMETNILKQFKKSNNTIHLSLEAFCKPNLPHRKATRTKT